MKRTSIKFLSVVLSFVIFFSINIHTHASFQPLNDTELNTEASVVKSDARVQTVIEKINAIGTLDYSDDCLSRIVNAERAYSALNDSQKEQVDNYGSLLAARSGYNALAADNVDTSDYTIVDNGVINSTVRWYFYDNGVLEISGTGAVPSYSSDAPWQSYVSLITAIIVRSSISEIGKEAFNGCNTVTSIVLPFVGKNRTAVGCESHLGFLFGCSAKSWSQFHSDDSYNIGDVYAVDVGYNKYISYIDYVYNVGNYHRTEYQFSIPLSLKKVTITDTSAISGGAFYRCDSITDVELNDDISCIGAYAFYCCTSLKNYAIPSRVSDIGQYAFYNNSSLVEMFVPDNTSVIKPYTFYGCSGIKKLVIGKNVTSVGDYSFYGNSMLTNLVIPDKTISIGTYTFANCSKLTSINIPDKVESIGSYVFSGDSKVETLYIGSSIKTIPSYAFNGCTGLKTLVVPDTVTKINDFAFYGCKNITNVTLPFLGESRTAVGHRSHFGYIFGYTTRGSASHISGVAGYEVGDVYDASSAGISYITSIISTNAYYSQYYVFNVPSALKTVKITDANSINDASFCFCIHITDIVLNDDISSVGTYAFRDVPWYENLSNEFNIVGNGVLIKYTGTKSTIVFPDAVKYIGNAVFKDNSRISDIIITDQITGIGAYAFSGCTNLTNITIPKTVTSIGREAIPSSCVISVYRPSAGYDYRSTNRIVLNNSYTTGQDTFYYVVNDDAVEIIGTETTSTEITVPEEIEGKVVRKIGDYGFANCTTLNSITIPSNIQSIGKNAFENCIGLVNATIPTTVSSIGDYAFLDCTNLRNVTISEGVTSIGKGCFANCTSLVEAVVPDTCVTLGAYAFYNCTSMTTATIGITADAVREYAFYNCEQLNSVVIGINVESIGDYAFYNCALGRVTIPATVTEIGDYAFANNRVMTRATLRKNLIKIGEGSFQNCEALSAMSLPTTMTSIGRFAFENCTSLQNVTIPAGVTVLNDFVFSNCASLATVTFNPNITRIGESAFYNNVFTTVSLPESVETIGKSAFRSCANLTSIYIPNATNTIGDSAFIDCTALTTASIPDGVQNMGSSVFVHNKDLTVTIRYLTGSIADSLLEKQGCCHVILDEDITKVGDLVFAYCYDLKDVSYGKNATNEGEFLFSANIVEFGCEVFKDATNLKKLIVPDTLQSIGENTFYNEIISWYNPSNITVNFYYVAGEIAEDILLDQRVSHIIVDDNICTIGDRAFNNCVGLESISLPDTIMVCGTDVFVNSTNEILLTVRGVDGIVDANIYKAKTAGIGYVVFDDNVASIGAFAFADGSTIKSVVINNAESIGDHAFEECKLIPEIVLPDTVREIGAYAFYNCNSMASINIPDGVPTINSHTFFGCASLLKVNLPDSVKRIEDYAYYGCVLINELTLGNSVNFIGEYAFYNCNKVAAVIIPETVVTIEDYAFRGCTSIKEIYLPDSVSTLGDCVFYACVGLEQVEFGTGITSIGDRVFYACVNLDKVVLNGNVDYIHDLAFYGAEDATLYAFENEYVEEYCYDMGLQYYNLNRDFDIVITPPTKTEYYEYDILETAGIVLNIIYTNGVERAISTGYTLSGYDMTQLGEQTVTVTYGGRNAFFTITVLPRTIRSISVISGIPSSIHQGDAIDVSGIVIEVQFTDDMTVNLTEGFTLSDFDNSVVGEQVLTVQYRNATVNVTVNVVPRQTAQVSKLVSINNYREYTVAVNDGEPDYFTSENTTYYPLGAVITVCAIDDGYFGYWKNESNVIVSRETSYSFVVTENVTISAVYNNKATNKVTVIFESYYGQVMARTQVTPDGAMAIELPGVPSRYGYIPLGWELYNDGIRDAVTAKLQTATFDDDILIVRPLYSVIPNTYTVNVIGGSGSGSYISDTFLTVRANYPETGKKFAYWIDQSGTIVSYNTEYGFYVNADCVLTAVYVDAGTSVEPVGLTKVIDIVHDEENGKFTFVSWSVVPDGCRIEAAGIVYTTDATVAASESSFTTDNDAVKLRTGSSDGTSYRYSWTVKTSKVIYVRAYLAYTDSAGNVITVYGNITSNASLING